MPDYRVQNRGATLGVLTLSSNFPAVNYDQLLTPNMTSTATVQAFWFPEPRRVYIAGTTSSHKVFGPGRVTLADLGIPPTADFVIDSWSQPSIPGGHTQV